MEPVSDITALLYQGHALKSALVFRRICTAFRGGFIEYFMKLEKNSDDRLANMVSLIVSGKLLNKNFYLCERDHAMLFRLNLTQLVVSYAKVRPSSVYRDALTFKCAYMIPRLVEAGIELDYVEFSAFCRLTVNTDMVISTLPLTGCYSAVKGLIYNRTANYEFFTEVMLAIEELYPDQVLEDVSQKFSKIVEYGNPRVVTWTLDHFNPFERDVFDVIESQKNYPDWNLVEIYRWFIPNEEAFGALQRDGRLSPKDRNELSTEYLKKSDGALTEAVVKKNSIRLFKMWIELFPGQLQEQANRIWKTACAGTYDYWGQDENDPLELTRPGRDGSPSIVNYLLSTSLIAKETIIESLYNVSTYYWKEDLALMLAQEVLKMSPEDIDYDLVNKFTSPREPLPKAYNPESVVLNALFLAADDQTLDGSGSVFIRFIKDLPLNRNWIYLETCRRGWSCVIITYLTRKYRSELQIEEGKRIMMETGHEDLISDIVD